MIWALFFTVVGSAVVLVALIRWATADEEPINNEQDQTNNPFTKMSERPINPVALIGTEAIYESYMACREAYGADFDRRMADIAITVISLQNESERPGGITFNEAAFLMLITEVEEDADPERRDRVNHELRACILWNTMEKPFLTGEVENLKKVLGDVRSG